MQNAYENNIIITESCKNLRALGRNALSGNWKVAIIAVLVYTLIIQIPTVILNQLFGVNVTELYSNGTYGAYSAMDPNAFSTMYNTMPSYSPLTGIYTVLVSGPLELGLALFFLAMFRRQIVEVVDIFLGFERFAKALGLLVYQSIFIFLWSLLFIIPGIIAAIRYSQAFYVLADDPEKSIKQCMDESKYMMKGNKAKYFLLSLSFIGWAALAGIVEGVISGINSVSGMDGFIPITIEIIAGLAIIPVTVYMQSTFAGFYEILSGHLIKATEPAPIEPVVPETPVVPGPVAKAPSAPAPAPQAPVEPAEPVVEKAAEPVLEVPEKPEVQVETAEAPVLEVAETPVVDVKPAEKPNLDVASVFEDKED